MKNLLSNALMFAGACALLFGMASHSQAAVLYKTGFGNYDGNNNASFTTNLATYTATGGSASGGGLGHGRGDDYNTAFTSLTLTSLRFVGNLQSTADSFRIDFYNPDGTRNTSASIFPFSPTDDYRTSTVHTVTLSSPVTVSGSGFIVFAPETFDFDNGAAPQISLGYSDGYNAAVFDVGTNNAATSVEANYGSSFPSSTARTLSSIDIPFTPDRLSLELNGTGIPEPTSFALLAPLALLLKRRRDH